MLNRICLATLFAAATLASTGCSGLQCGSSCAAKSPYAFMQYDCACETCGAGECAGNNDSCTCGQYVGGGQPCRSCGGAGCDACGGCTLYRNASCKCGPFPCLRWLGGWLDCAGCGECYWNEWYNDPPACADPCDCYGNWAGPGSPGYYRAPYRSHHGWLANQHAEPLDEEQAGDLPIVQPPSALAALDAAAATQDAAPAAAETALYDDSDLNAELQ